MTFIETSMHAGTGLTAPSFKMLSTKMSAVSMLFCRRSRGVKFLGGDMYQLDMRFVIEALEASSSIELRLYN